MLSAREIAIYALGKTEGVNSLAETLGKGMDDEKYIESWNKTLKLLGIEMKLEDLEAIYNEFAKKMEDVVNDKETHELKKKWENFDIDDKYWIIIESNNFSRRKR